MLEERFGTILTPASARSPLNAYVMLYIGYTTKVSGFPPLFPSTAVLAEAHQ